MTYSDSFISFVKSKDSLYETMSTNAYEASTLQKKRLSNCPQNRNSKKNATRSNESGSIKEYDWMINASNTLLMCTDRFVMC